LVVAKGSLDSDFERKVLAFRAIDDPRIRTIASSEQRSPASEGAVA
jgi:hypothetical protein